MSFAVEQPHARQQPGRNASHTFEGWLGHAKIRMEMHSRSRPGIPDKIVASRNAHVRIGLPSRRRALASLASYGSKVLSAPKCRASGAKSHPSPRQVGQQ